MPGQQQQSVIASNEDLRKMVVLVHSTFAYGSSIVAVTLALGWGFVGVRDGVDVPTILPILAIAAVLFMVVAWTTQEEIQRIGVPSQAKRK
jgi:hypothetical protein